MKRNQSGFSVVAVVLIVLTLAVVGFTGWLVWQNQNDSSSEQTTSTTDTASSGEPLSLVEPKLPEGWAADTKEPQYILLGNATTGCFTNVTFTTDLVESNSPDIDQKAQTVESIKSKEGYIVEELPEGRLTVNAKSGEKQIDAQVLRVSGPDAMFQNYAYITDGAYYIRIQLSCPKESDFEAAKEALLAIKINVD